MIVRTGLLLLLVLVLTSAQAVQTLSWDQQPIALELVVGVEQLLRFDGPASVGIPASLAHRDVFRAEFVNHTAYWKAMAPFSRQRIKVRLDGSGQFVLFDVVAVTLEKPPITTEPIRIAMPDPATVTTISNPASQLTQETDQDTTLFDLIRYAAQTHHAPQRLVQVLPGLRPLDPKVSADLSVLYQHSDSVHLEIKARQSWATAGLYVTALEVRNESDRLIDIDTRLLQHTVRPHANGLSHQFIAAATLRPSVAPRGEVNDSALIYIVTERPLASVIELGP